MKNDWREPQRVEAHRFFNSDPLALLPATAVQREAFPTLTVEEVFRAGLLAEVVLGPRNQINSRIDAFFDGFRELPILEGLVDLKDWGILAAEANTRKRKAESFLGQTLQGARDFLASAPGRFLLNALPFEDRAQRNDTHEVLYFRDSGIHRRLIERTVGSQPERISHVNADAMETSRAQRVELYVPKRWEAFVVTTIIDLVGRRCNAFAYRHEEEIEIDLILEWTDRTSPERWAIEVASRKFNTHPSRHFAEECEHLGVQPQNRYVVRLANECDGGARGRGGVPAISLPRMIDRLQERLRR